MYDSEIGVAIHSNQKLMTDKVVFKVSKECKVQSKCNTCWRGHIEVQLSILASNRPQLRSTLCLDLKSFNRKRLITFSLIHSNLLLKTVLLLTLFPSFCLPLSKRSNDSTTVATSSNLVVADKRRQLENPVSQNTTWRLYKFKVLFHVQLDSIMQGSED